MLKTTRVLHMNKIFYSTNYMKQFIPELDTSYIFNPENLNTIEENILKRKGIGNIQLIHDLNKKIQSIESENPIYLNLQNKLISELLKLPNRTHPTVQHYDNDPKIIELIGVKQKNDQKPLQFHEIAKKLKLMRTEQVGQFNGSKSYYFHGELAQLEQAIINYFVLNLLADNFELISVPDILSREIVEGCGMNTRGTRAQVFELNEELHGPDLCLSGTSEMSLAAFLSLTAPKSLPKKLVGISRCFRAETSKVAEERGIYRVHEFTKVEMFVACLPSDSDVVLETIRQKQTQLFESLGLHFRVLDMPPHELGAQAYRKYDIEAWMTGREMYGEISSCSNCLDYQSRRLGIKGMDGEFLHTLNGTACAIPRLLIALMEQRQRANGTVDIPDVLQPFMSGKKVIGKQKSIPEVKLIKKIN